MDMLFSFLTLDIPSSAFLYPFLYGKKFLVQVVFVHYLWFLT